MIFLSVGSQLPFDRLVCSVDEALGRGVIDEAVFGQIGDSDYKPVNFEYVSSLDRSVFEEKSRQCSCMISHAGMGVILLALNLGKPLLVMSRLSRRGEAVNDHQVELARRFERDGYLLAASNRDEFAGKVQMLKDFVPNRKSSEAFRVVERIGRFFDSQISR